MSIIHISKKFLKFFLKTRWYFCIPEKKEIILYDVNPPNILEEYFKELNVYYLYINLEKINLYILVKGIFSKLFKWNFFEGYIIEYIRHIKPKIIITYIDNNIKFLELKFYFPEIQTVIIQNGLRLNDYFDILKKTSNYLQADKFFVWNYLIGKMYSKYINNCKFYTIGSVKNNFKKINKNLIKKNILFISEFREITPHTKSFYSVEEKLIPFLYKFSKRNSFSLNICRSAINSNNEYAFYKKILQNDDWSFLEYKNIYSNYDHIDNSFITVFISSSLGYESISRGNRTAAFSVRGLVTNFVGHNFGWPYKFKKTGKTWTNIYDEKIFNNILNFLIFNSINKINIYQKKNFSKLLIKLKNNQKLLSNLNLNSLKNEKNY